MKPLESNFRFEFNHCYFFHLTFGIESQRTKALLLKVLLYERNCVCVCVRGQRQAGEWVPHCLPFSLQSETLPGRLPTRAIQSPRNRMRAKPELPSLGHGTPTGFRRYVNLPDRAVESLGHTLHLHFFFWPVKE